jgi:hypothetical protein
MMKPVHDERLFAPVNFADAKDMRLSYLGRLTASLAEKRRLGFDLNDIHVDKRLLADDGWEGYRQIIAQNAAIILAQRSPPEGGPWSAELVILDAEEWPRLCSLVAQPDGRLITWGPAPAPEGIRIAEVDAGGADAVWKLIRGARGRPVYRPLCSTAAARPRSRWASFSQGSYFSTSASASGRRRRSRARSRTLSAT